MRLTTWNAYNNPVSSRDSHYTCSLNPYESYHLTGTGFLPTVSLMIKNNWLLKVHQTPSWTQGAKIVEFCLVGFSTSEIPRLQPGGWRCSDANGYGFGISPPLSLFQKYLFWERVSQFSSLLKLLKSFNVGARKMKIWIYNPLCSNSGWATWRVMKVSQLQDEQMWHDTHLGWRDFRHELYGIMSPSKWVWYSLLLACDSPIRGCFQVSCISFTQII